MTQQPIGDEPSAGSAHANGMSEGLRVLSYLLGGLAFYGVLGWLGDRYFDTAWMLPTGMVLGMAGAVYLIIRRYGQTPAPADQTSQSAKTKDTL